MTKRTTRLRQLLANPKILVAPRRSAEAGAAGVGLIALRPKP
jgi:hypothetical protein